MKNLFFKSSANGFLIFLLFVAFMLTGAVFIWYVQHLSKYTDMQLFAPHQHSFWFAAAVISTLVVFMAALLVTIQVFYKSQKTLLIKNAAIKRTEEKIRESKEWLHAVFETSRDGIVIEDGAHIAYANESYAQLLGYETCADLIGKPDATTLPPDEAARLAEYGRRRLRGESVPSLYEYTGKRQDGTLISMEAAVSLTIIGGKQYIVSTVRDITQRKQSEAELQKNLSILASTFEATADGILMIDLDNRIVTYNQRFAEMWQLPAEKMESKSNSIIVKYVAAQLINAGEFTETTKYLRDHPEKKYFDYLRFKDGRIYERYSHPHILNGKVVGRVVSCRDISERKRAEKAVRQSEERYRTILETIEEGYYEVDLMGSFTFFNHALVACLKYDEEELEGLNYRRYVDKKTAKRLARIYRKVYITGQFVSDLEYEIIRRDGTRMCAESSVSIIRGEKNQVIGFRGVVRDVTARKQSEDKLRQSESLLAAAQRITHLGSWELELTSLEDASKNRVQWSDEVYRIFGFEPQQFKVFGDVFYSFVQPEERKRASRAILEAIENKTNLNIESWIFLPNGSERLVQVKAEIVYDGRTKQPLKLVGTIQDITERKRAESALRESENKFRMLVENTSEGLMQVDKDDRVKFINDRFCEMVGYSAGELLNKNWTQILLDNQERGLVEQANERRQRGVTDRYEMKLRKKSGELFWVAIGGAPILDAEGIIIGSLGVFSDVTERKRAEERLLHDAFHDGLTGLANRALFMDHLRMTIERGKTRQSNLYAILFLDFDRFKVINDSLGHAEGDNLLKCIARRLESSTRGGDLVARFGGDEFVILLSEMLEEDDAVQIAERIQHNLKNPFDLGGSEVFVSASIGIALSTAGHKRAEDMLRDADIAMYRAKAKGKAQYQIFDQAMHEYASRQLLLETEMRRALERREFFIHYQPIINLENESLVGFEALVRWKHPDRGMILPVEFIPAAEENNLILPLGKWILLESCRQLRQWQKTNRTLAHLKVCVNLSSKQFSQPDLIEQITHALQIAELNPQCLKLEITESHIMENTETAVTMMNQVRELGVELSLDDFGTGYSSLSYLHRLPVNYLKIDRSFVSRMIESGENGEIVHTIIKLAQNLKMKVVAEGIETAEQLDYLKNLGCEFGQGYFFSKPLEAAAAAKFINETKETAYEVDQTIFNLEMNI